MWSPAPSGAYSQSNGCSLATLQGNYIWHQDGFSIEDEQQIPFAWIGQETIDGNGNLSGEYSGSWGGHIYQKVSYTGKYSLNADCSGMQTMAEQSDDDSDNETYYYIYVDPTTGDFFFTSSEEGEVTQGVYQKVL